MKQFIKFLSIMVIAFLFLTATAFAEKVTFVKEYNYNASDLDSKVSSRTIALEQVKRLLLEELGTYLISETEVKNFRLTKDQVTTYSAGVVSAEVVDEKWDGKTYYLKAKVSADTVDVTKALQNIVNDKQKSKELEDVRKKAAEFSKEIERLKKELAIAKTDTKKPEQKGVEKVEGKVIYTSQALIKQYNEAVKGLSATDWFEKGYKSAISGNYQQAINDYNKAIQLNPQLATAYNNRGLAYDNLGNYQQAINDYNKAIQLNPQFALAYNNRGLAYIKLGNHQQAINDFNKAIQLNPQYAMAYIARGLAYARVGNYQQSIKDFNKTIELNPQYAMAYNNRGTAYGELGNYQQAIKDFTKAIELNPQFALAYNNRGLAYIKLGNHQQAINDFNKVIELDPKLAEAYAARGHSYADIGNYQQAIKDYSKAIELNSKYAEYDARGLAYARVGDSQRAINDLNKALELKPNDNGVYYNGACLYSVLNKPEKACDYLKKSIQKGYSDWNWIKKDKDFDNIRNSSCYKEIMAGK